MLRLALCRNPPVAAGRRPYVCAPAPVHAALRLSVVSSCLGLSGAGLACLESQRCLRAGRPSPTVFRQSAWAREADPNRVILHLRQCRADKIWRYWIRPSGLLDEAERQGRAMQLEVIATSRNPAAAGGP